MHNIHWAIIFSNSTIGVALLVLAFALARSARTSKKKPKTVFGGDKVQVTLSATGETREGTVTGIGTLADGFSIICK